MLVDIWMKNCGHQENVQQFDTKYSNAEEMNVLRQRYSKYLKFLFGGEKQYDGRPLAEIHRYVGVKPEQFDEANQQFLLSLRSEACKPKPRVFKAMVQKVQALRDSIVIPLEEELKRPLDEIEE